MQRIAPRIRHRVAVAAALASVAAATTTSPAGAKVYCVPNTTVHASCEIGDSTLQGALTAAQGTSLVADTVRIGPGSFPIQSNGYSDASDPNAVQIIGSGQGATTLSYTNTVSPFSTGFNFSASAASTLQDLSIVVGPNLDGIADTALRLEGQGTTRDVSIDAGAHTHAVGVVMQDGAVLDDATIEMGASSNNFGVRAPAGQTLVTDSEITAEYGLNEYGTGSSLTIRRSTIHSRTGVTLDAGTINVADSVIDLGAHNNATGVQAANFNNGTSSMSVDASQLTIVGGGSNSIGVHSQGDSGPDPNDMADDGETSTVTLANSVISGPPTAIAVEADRGESATVTSTYSNYTAPTVEDDDLSNGNANGFATLNETNHSTHADPGFVNAGAGDFHLLPSSPLVDAGDPAPVGAGPLDLDGEPRALDGSLDCFATARRDIGADEVAGAGGQLDCIAPDTSVSGKAKLKSKKRTVRVSFTLGATEVGSSFECSLDGAAFAPCASPFTTKAKRGKHTLQARAKDASGNQDASPASFAFTIKKKKAKKK